MQEQWITHGSKFGEDRFQVQIYEWPENCFLCNRLNKIRGGTVMGKEAEMQQCVHNHPLTFPVMMEV